MVSPGDIVYRLRKGGFIHDRPVVVKDSIGLVIKELTEKGAVSQAYVQFSDKEVAQWYYQHDLCKIRGERKKNV